jgi:hypothetical protein
MTILDELISAVRQAAHDYERATNTLSIKRAKEIDEIKAEFDINHTALTFRRTLAQKIEKISGAPLGFPIFLDWNGFRRRLRNVLDEEKFSLINILIAENKEMQLDRVQLSKTVAELSYKVETGPGGPYLDIVKLEEQAQILIKRLQEQTTACQQFQIENKFLSEQLSTLEKERNFYKQKFETEEDKSKQLYQRLMEKIAELAETKSLLETIQKKHSGTEYNSSYAKLYT